MDLTEDQIERYSRQIILNEIGGIGQKKLLKSKVSLIGLGALGSSAAYYLTAAGVGNLQLIDFDVVEMSNLHRQILYHTKDINSNKTESAVQKLNALNPDCKIDIITERITPENSRDILRDSDFVIEGSDNFPTKMLINDTCVYLNIPFTIAGVLRFHGQIMTVIPKRKTTCYKCIFDDVNGMDPNMTCSVAGVIGFVPGIFGCIEANEAIKCLLNIGDLIVNKILFIDILKNNFSFIEVLRNTNCKSCGDSPKEFKEITDYWSEDFCR
ncbi:MAG: ThiF family adenylyltransferase [Candidatus Hodarchaeota archaeon]